MTEKHSSKVNKKIESLCVQGCNEVNQLLEKADNGEVLNDLSEFSRLEISQIIDELSKIMAVYDKSNNCED